MAEVLVMRANTTNAGGLQQGFPVIGPALRRCGRSPGIGSYYAEA